MINPIQLTMPETETIAVVPMVATHNSKVFSLRGDKPIEWAVRSSSDKMFILHRKAERTARETPATGMTGRMVSQVALYNPPIIQKVMSCNLVDGSATSLMIDKAAEKKAPTAMPARSNRRIQPPKVNERAKR